MNTTANANLFSRLFDGLDDPNRLAIETTEGERITYGDLIARSGRVANVLIARQQEREHVYLTDFGLTKMAVSSQGETATATWNIPPA